MENCTCLELKFLVDKKLFSCIAIYRSPSGGIERFIEQLEQVLEGERDSDLKILTGDININIRNLNNNQVDDYLNLLSINGYLFQHNKITRVGRITEGTCLDHNMIILCS